MENIIKISFINLLLWWCVKKKATSFKKRRKRLQLKVKYARYYIMDPRNTYKFK